MTDEEKKALVQAIANIKRELLDLRSQFQAVKVAVACLSIKQGFSPGKMISLMDALARDLTEKALLDIGETSPLAAELLGVEEFLRKLDPPPGEQ